METKTEQVQLSVYLPKPEAELLTAAARRDDRSVASYLRRMVRDHLGEQATA